MRERRIVDIKNEVSRTNQQRKGENKSAEKRGEQISREKGRAGRSNKKIIYIQRKQKEQRNRNRKPISLSLTLSLLLPFPSPFLHTPSISIHVLSIQVMGILANMTVLDLPNNSSWAKLIRVSTGMHRAGDGLF
jgi:hypothetical protein